MQGKQQYMEVLEGWRAFVEAAGLAKSRIRDADIHEHQQIKLSRRSLQEDDSGFHLSLPDTQAVSLTERFTSQDEQGRVRAEALQLGFPLLRVVEGQKAFFIPLFRYSLPDTWHSAMPLELTVPVKQGSEVSPNVDAFRLYLDIDIQELGAERHMMSIAAACIEDSHESFGALFEAFLRWVKQRLADHNRPASSTGAELETAFTAIISPEVSTDFNTKEQLKDYKALLQRSELQAPLLQHYIEHRSNAVTTPPLAARTPYGLFERQYPLGRGQMIALTHISGGAELLAVQGAPGTGKTTLFKSLIASQIVERALACIAGKDRNLGLVVTSTAKKAVENVIDDLRKDACLQDINWLYFQGGDSGQVTAESERVSALLQQLDAQVHDQAKQNELAAQIIEKQQLIDDCSCRFETLRQAFEDLRAPLKGVSPEEFVKQTDLLRGNVLQMSMRLGLCSPQERPESTAWLREACVGVLRSFAVQRAQHNQAKERLSRSYSKLLDAPFALESYREWLGCALSESLEHHFADHPTRGFGLLLATWFKRGYTKARQHLQKSYSAEFSKYGLANLDHLQLAKLAQNRKELFATGNAEALLEAAKPDGIDTHREGELAQLSKDVDELERRTGNWQRYVAAERALKDEFPEGDWLEVLRKRFIAEQRALFEYAIDYLWQELLRQKALLNQVLPLWSDMLSGKQNGGFYGWKDKLEEFYRLLTLAYPVMASTLASVHKLAGYKLEILNGVTPYQLSLVDEAGMISAESLVPLLARSQRAIVVGDPLQIEPIRSLDTTAAEKLKDKYFPNNTLYEAVSPMLVTGYHRAAGTLSGSIADIGNGIVLDEHRRCQRPIAELFMSIAEYSGVQVCTAAPDANIQAACNNMGGFNLMFYGVQGRRGTLPNTNVDEVEAIGLLLDKLETAGYDLTQDVGIITPYSNQKNLLIKAYGERLKQRAALKIGSVHQFQGVGFEVIIYSPVIFQRTDRDAFQNSKPNLLNVAVSRAKQQFIVVGNQHRLLSAGKSLGRMAEACSESFFVNMEHQSPLFEEVRTDTAKHYLDCEHIAAFEALVSSSRRSFTAVVPWIRQGSTPNHPPLKMLRAAQERGVAVKVYYGYDEVGKADADDGDPGLILAYQRHLGTENVIRLPEGTHEKILLVDDQVITVGSWNWLSHGYYRYCSMPSQERLALRRETTVELRDPKLIADLKARITQ
ncbi:AAA domain-containing protein [Pseudomonas sp. TUM22785]|uniref:AAA domain-containing protein n=1 Tax=Pseudomonas sp. TUM22785 TaxID=3019098 RepID=UPI002304F531|nr:AAA domain-containing protein [Pseudomonas sp. TUM22785]WCD78511.1 AAA domain-containing protein [Pseudomonas sp. TUM22785]